MTTVIKYEHKVEILHEPSFEGFEFTFTADENTDPMEIFRQLCDELSIIVHSVEEMEVELKTETICGDCLVPLDDCHHKGEYK
jgi:hypothetical protein